MKELRLAQVVPTHLQPEARQQRGRLRLMRREAMILAEQVRGPAAG